MVTILRLPGSPFTRILESTGMGNGFMTEHPQLLFVYNASSGWLNGVVDTLHKIVRPETYSCQLCQLTYGTVRMKQEWKYFIDKAPFQTRFMHRDTFQKKYGKKKDREFPMIYIWQQEEWQPFIQAHDLEKCETLSELQQHIIQKLQQAD